MVSSVLRHGTGWPRNPLQVTIVAVLAEPLFSSTNRKNEKLRETGLKREMNPYLRGSMASIRFQRLGNFHIQTPVSLLSGRALKGMDPNPPTSFNLSIKNPATRILFPRARLYLASFAHSQKLKINLFFRGWGDKHIFFLYGRE